MPPDTVYVIDDDEAARHSLAFLLKSAKIEVKTFESAVAFLDNIVGITTGCVITDVRMPEITGTELLRRLKELNVGLP
jgi:two-component system, LuxR family, response regulator FixJ